MACASGIFMDFLEGLSKVLDEECAAKAAETTFNMLEVVPSQEHPGAAEVV